MLAGILMLASCASSGGGGEDRVLSGDGAAIKNAIKSDFLVKSGSVLKVDYANGSRFFVESGGKLEGFGKGLRKTQVFAEKGADLPEALRDPKYRKQVRLVQATDATKAYEERNLPWNDKAPVVVDESDEEKPKRRVYRSSYYGWAWYGDPYFYGGYPYYSGYSGRYYRGGSRFYGSRSFRGGSYSRGGRGFSSRGSVVGARVVR